MPIDPKVDKTPAGLTKGQGNLILLLLAANIWVQVMGRETVMSGAATIEDDSASSGFSLAMWALTVAEWTGIVAGGAILICMVFLAIFIWWNQRQLGRPDHVP